MCHNFNQNRSDWPNGLDVPGRALQEGNAGRAFVIKLFNLNMIKSL
jgi:hypothetical protein